MRRLSIFGLFICLSALLLVGGCASMDPDRDSDMPWNVPQSWEGSPSIPGLGN
jgi:hypothetical protein